MKKRYNTKAPEGSRLYVCHTYYHVYVSLLMECNREDRGTASIALSSMSTDFETLQERLEALKLFRTVYILPEKRFTEIPELAKYKENCGPVKNLIHRLIFTKKYPKLEEPYMTIDFTQYRDIYVFCDLDPIGFYLNYKHIYYHAMEDGKGNIRLDGVGRTNPSHFRLNCLLARLNLFFVQNGFSKYCLEYVVDNAELRTRKYRNLRQMSIDSLEAGLSSEELAFVMRAFLPRYDEEMACLRSLGDDAVLLLTEPYHFDVPTQTRIVRDLLAKHCEGCRVVIKPHPHDKVDYKSEFPETIVLPACFPIEILRYVPGIHFAKAYSIISTAMKSLSFVDEKINLGVEFWDAYEPRELHSFKNI